MIELVAGSLQYTNLKVASWIQENMDYEAVQDAKSKEAFEVDLQEAKVRVAPLVALLVVYNAVLHLCARYSAAHTHTYTYARTPPHRALCSCG